MAVAEARAAWQRAANRCFVQEDAKTAPKLSCCPSASPSSKQVDAGPANGADGQDTPIVGLFPPSRNHSYSNLPPDLKWWLRLQPIHGYERALANEQLNTLEVETEAIKDSLLSSTSSHGRVHPQNQDDDTPIDDNKNTKPFLDTHYSFSAAFVKKDCGVQKQELKSVCMKNFQDPLKLEGSGEIFELLDMDPVKCSVSKQYSELCIDSESPWIGGEKTEPWWRTADRDELALLVAHRSLDLIENCDLPRPQNLFVKEDTNAQFGCFDDDGILAASRDWKSQIDGRPNLADHIRDNLNFGNPCGKQWASVEAHLQSATDKPISERTTHKAVNEAQISDDDPSKAKLLEALRHSQTRAREAEKAAKQAYAEEEHIIKLFFRQASHLFAYKQWFQLLQLENLCLQIKSNKDQTISTLFPFMLPCVPYKIRKPRKSWQKGGSRKRAKRGRPRYCDLSKLAIVFALGLGLVGAGLLLGWTVGWMLPTF